MKKLLVVEDDTMVRRALVNLLREKGYTVEDARDGWDALKQVDFAGFEPDVVVTDTQMPRMGGLELLHRLREPSRATVKVVMMSGDIGMESLAIRAGADAFLAKPFLTSKLVEAIEAL